MNLKYTQILLNEEMLKYNFLATKAKNTDSPIRNIGVPNILLPANTTMKNADARSAFLSQENLCNDVFKLAVLVQLENDIATAN